MEKHPKQFSLSVDKKMKRSETPPITPKRILVIDMILLKRKWKIENNNKESNSFD